MPTCNIKESGGSAPSVLSSATPSALNPPPRPETHRERQYLGAEFQKFDGLKLMCGIIKQHNATPGERWLTVESQPQVVKY